jgi:hypothetical protein
MNDKKKDQQNRGTGIARVGAICYFLWGLVHGKHYFSALCAVERKLIHLIYGVWKRGTPFELRQSTADA